MKPNTYRCGLHVVAVATEGADVHIGVAFTKKGARRALLKGIIRYNDPGE